MGDYFRGYLSRPLVRPWALSGPVLVLLICLPLLRPLRHPAQIPTDETLTMLTIRALVERGTPSIQQVPSGVPHERIVTGRDGRRYSDQPPMMAVLLSLPAWVMVRSGLSFDENHLLISYLLTMLGVTLPVAAAAGLIYRMGRLFELKRPWRAGLGVAVVAASGLLSYAVVLNPHAPSAVLVLASAACLIHVASGARANRRWFWLLMAGASGGLAATLDPPAVVLVILFLFVIAAMRFSIVGRVTGVGLFLLGVAATILLHAHWNSSITGDWFPASLHQEMARGEAPVSPLPVMIHLDDEDPTGPGLLATIAQPLQWLARALVGSNGLLSHFPVVIFGVAGVFAVMHRHWPSSTKILAAATLFGGVTIILMYCIWRADFARAMFASRWFVVFVPLLLFWIGAWIRRSHSPVTWSVAGILLGFSTLVSLIGATGPYPVEGFRGYTVVSAARKLFLSESRPPVEPALETTVAGNSPGRL